MRGFEEGKAMRAEQDRRRSEQAAAQAASQADIASRNRQYQTDVILKNAAQMVSQGRCLDAQKYAAEGGEFKLATDIASYCKVQAK